jgi:hypothetical protein
MSTRNTKIADIIWSVLPGDKTFTLNDVLGWLEAADPDRRWVRQSLYVNLNRFLTLGSIKRVSYARPGNPALFAMPDVETPEAKTMLE